MQEASVFVAYLMFVKVVWWASPPGQSAFQGVSTLFAFPTNFMLAEYQLWTVTFILSLIISSTASLIVCASYPHSRCNSLGLPCSMILSGMPNILISFL